MLIGETCASFLTLFCCRIESIVMSLMNSVSLIDETPEWTLTLNPVVFDRLHRGSLMKKVIRGGRRFRETLLHTLRNVKVHREVEIAR